MPKKNPARRNRVATRATLSLVPTGIDIPELPQRTVSHPETGEPIPVAWHPRTVQWWEDIWASPMAPEFLKADVHGLYLLAELEDRFHKAESTHGKLELAKEIRLQRAMFGLTPMDRRRLQWEVERGDQAEEKTAQRRRKKVAKHKDPRSQLAGVE